MQSRRMTNRLFISLFLAIAGLTCLSGVVSGSTAQSDDLWRQFDPDSVLSVDHTKWDALLSRYLVIGEDGINRFRYGAVTPDDRALLDSYIAELETRNVAGLNRNEQFAYWANLYNAVTIRLIVDNYPVKSIRVIKSGPFSPGPWKMKLITVMGQEISLDTIEHDILRAQWQDPRVHYAVNCASIGCPNLLDRAFRANTLERMLDAGARAYINHPRGVRVDQGQLKVSSIYKWFKEDFGGTQTGIIEHLKQYADDALAAQIDQQSTISDYDYDWSLNDIMAVPAAKSAPSY